MTSQTPSVSPEVMEALLDPEVWFERYVKIVDKHRKLVPFKLKPAQQDFMAKLKARSLARGRKQGFLVGRDTLLKSRKLGFTTLALELLYHEAATIPNTVGAFLSYEKAIAQRAFQIVRTTHKYMPLEDEGIRIQPSLSRNSMNAISFDKMNSRLFIGTAGTMQFGRGDTPNLVVLDEFAFYPPHVVEELMAGLLNSLDPNDSWVLAVSTPNGHNHFRRLYMDAKESGAIWRSHFYPWPWEIREDVTIDPGNEGVPETFRDDFEPTADEAALMSKFDITLDHIRWRRWKTEELILATGRGKIMRQEFPETDIDCFLFSGDLFFDEEAMELYVNDARKPPFTRENGNVLIWKKAEAKGSYVIAGDPSEGLGGDHSRSSGVVLNTRSGEHVASIRGRLPPERFGELLAGVGREYNMAVVAVERNNHGHAVLQKLRGLGYEKIYNEQTARPTSTSRPSDRQPSGRQGWLTTEMNRPAMLDEFSEAIRSRNFVTYDEALVEEMSSFRYADNGRPEKQPDGWDDTIIAASIAWRLRYHKIGGYGKPMRAGRWPS